MNKARLVTPAQFFNQKAGAHLHMWELEGDMVSSWQLKQSKGKMHYKTTGSCLEAAKGGTGCMPPHCLEEMFVGGMGGHIGATWSFLLQLVCIIPWLWCTSLQLLAPSSIFWILYVGIFVTLVIDVTVSKPCAETSLLVCLLTKLLQYYSANQEKAQFACKRKESSR